MVNTDDFIKRLELLLDYYSLSASAFADTIGIQRSGLSHLLSGRNKPSLDFIMKITERYPEVNLYWLLNGKGTFPKDSPLLESTPSASTPAESIPTEPLDLFSKSEDYTEEIKQEDLHKAIVKNTFGEIESIVVFYKDGTFKNYHPQ